MQLHERRSQATTKELRSFAFIVGGGFVVAWAIRFITSGHRGTALISTAGILIALGACYPRILLRPYQAWMAIGSVMGNVTSRLLLGAVYVIVLTPIAVLRRWKVRDPLELRCDAGTTSYFHAKHVQPTKQFERMF